MVSNSLEGVPRGAEHLAAFPSLCGPTHPQPSQLGLSRVIEEVRASDTALHHSPYWSKSHCMCVCVCVCLELFYFDFNY